MERPGDFVIVIQSPLRHAASMKLNEQAILRFMNDAAYKPMDQSQMARALEIHSNDRAALRNILSKLAAAGKILQGRHRVMN